MAVNSSRICSCNQNNYKKQKKGHKRTLLAGAAVKEKIVVEKEKWDRMMGNYSTMGK